MPNIYKILVKMMHNNMRWANICDAQSWKLTFSKLLHIITAHF